MIKSNLTPPTIDQATIDHYVAKGRRERSLAIAALFRAIFAAPEQRDTPAAQFIRSKLGASS